MLLGIFFTCLQIIEYKTANFSINDGIYGSIFYMATGFHGIHVLIGTLYLIHSIYRSFSKVYPIRWRKHIGFETAAWYWHFVDVVWLFLYGVVYWWGSS